MNAHLRNCRPFNPNETTEERWLFFIRTANPTVAADPTCLQYQEMRMAFYAASMETFVFFTSVSDLPEEAACRCLDKLEQELIKYAIRSLT